MPVWLDCDPGHDDAFALILAGWSPLTRLVGVSTVHGNAPLEATTRNALTVLHAAGLGHVPVVAGAARPLLRAGGAHAAHVHGEDGLGLLASSGAALPSFPEARAVEGKAVSYMATAIAAARRGYGGSGGGSGGGGGSKVTLVATGPLTNVALLLAVFPEVAADLERIVVMGGALGRVASGNIGVNAEFNIVIDPDAAEMVVNNDLGVEVVLVPLDVTHTALVTPDVLRRVAEGGAAAAAPAPAPAQLSGASAAASSGAAAEPEAPALAPAAAQAPTQPPSAFRKMLADLLRFFAFQYVDVMGMPDPPLHDPCAVFFVVNALAFAATRAHVEVERSPRSITLGQTVVDWLDVLKARKNCVVTTAMDVPSFWAALLDAIAHADAHSPMNSAADVKRARAALAAASPWPTSPAAAAAASPGAAARLLAAGEVAR